jgi:S1-C subfamily serine protease
MYTTMILAVGILLPSAPPEIPRPVRENGIAVSVRVTDPATEIVGTGVVLGVHEKYVHILTAAHLLGPGAKPRVETFASGAVPKVDGVFDSCEVLMRLTAPDLAVLRLPAGKRTWRAVPLAPAEIPDLVKNTHPERGWAIGCDDGKDPLLEAVPVTGARLIRRKDGEKNAFFWESAGKIVAGRSGGPLLDEKGRLIGICSGMQKDSSYYTHSFEIASALKLNGLKWLLDEVDKR